MNKNENIQLDETTTIVNDNFVSINPNAKIVWTVFIDMNKYGGIEIATEDGQVYEVNKDKLIQFLKDNGIIKRKKQSLLRGANGRFLPRKK